MPGRERWSNPTSSPLRFNGRTGAVDSRLGRLRAIQPSDKPFNRPTPPRRSAPFGPTRSPRQAGGFVSSEHPVLRSTDTEPSRAKTRQMKKGRHPPFPVSGAPYARLLSTATRPGHRCPYGPQHHPRFCLAATPHTLKGYDVDRPGWGKNPHLRQTRRGHFSHTVASIPRRCIPIGSSHFPQRIPWICTGPV